MVEQAYSAAGDKYRLSLINISAVKNWFNPDKAPRAAKKKSVLLIPCKKHIKIRDIGLKTRTFKYDIEYQTQGGETFNFEKGKPVGQLLSGWLSALDQFEPKGERRDS